MSKGRKLLPDGVCDHCGQPFPPGLGWYTRRGPRRYCSIDCRNTANARAGGPIVSVKNKQRMAEGRWQNPAKLHPPTSEEQSRRSRLGRLREVAAGRWRNPALSTEARAKLSRPRVHTDNPVLHSVFEKLRRGRVADLTDEERAAYRVYQQQLRDARRAERTPEDLVRLRARWRAYWRARQHPVPDEPSN